MQEDIERTVAEPVPLHLRNPVTPLLREFSYGAGYQYAHDHPEKTTAMPCLPESLRNRRYYLPSDAGYERKLRERLLELLKLWGRK